MYHIQTQRSRRYFPTLEEAHAYAERFYARTGVVLGIVEGSPRLTGRQYERLTGRCSRCRGEGRIHGIVCSKCHGKRRVTASK